MPSRATVAAMLARTRATVREHGWAVQGVSSLACETPGCTTIHDPNREQSDPYLYTVGLTASGLPELLLRLADKNSIEWMKRGNDLLNTVAAHTMHQELVVGESLPAGDGVLVTVCPPPPFSRDGEGNIWPGFAYEMYGRHNVRVLEVVPSW
jgi:Domain of unknown function (DUF4262)